MILVGKGAKVRADLGKDHLCRDHADSVDACEVYTHAPLKFRSQIKAGFFLVIIYRFGF